MKKLGTTKKKALKHCADYIELHRCLPKWSYLAQKTGITLNSLRHHFSWSKEILKEQTLEEYPHLKGFELYTPKTFQSLKKEMKGFKRFVITTAVAESPVDKSFLASINNYCKVNEACLLILPANQNFDHIDPILTEENIVFDEIALNKKIHVSNIQVEPKQVDPLAGLERLGQRNGSFIFASPKQSLRLVATGNYKLPHALMTTGAITLPKYQASRYKSKKRNFVASNDHVMGAIIVEIVDNQLYHYRQIQADGSGGFCDLGKYYQGKSVKKVPPIALVMGDYHSAEVDKVVEQAHVELIKELKPSQLFLHDAFDGQSISHHDKDSNAKKSALSLANRTSLAKELKELSLNVNKFADLVDHIIWVKSNHDTFLDRYLNTRMWLKDHENGFVSSLLYPYAIAKYVEGTPKQKLKAVAKALEIEEAQLLKLYPDLLDGKSPLQVALEQRGLKNKHKYKFLEYDEDYFIAGIQMGCHGDKGPNGSRGSLRAMERSYGNSISGHTHTPAILRGAWQVGTCSILRPEYAKGPSSWFHTSCLVYPNGQRQLINFIGGEYRLTSSKSKSRKAA